MASTTIDIAALVYAVLSHRLAGVRVSAAALTDTLAPKNLPAVIYEVIAPESVSNAPRAGCGTRAIVSITALGADRVTARGTCDRALTALMDSVGDTPQGAELGWVNRVRLTQEPVAASSAEVAGAHIYQYSALCEITARRT